MEENPPNDRKPSAKSTLKDILINANNDDVIIPTSATFDKVVLHIGIGSRSGVTIEKHPVKDDKALITSVEFATRKFKKSFYKGDNKGLDATGKERGDFWRTESDEKFRKDMQNETDVERLMSRLASSFYSQAPLESKNDSTENIDDELPDTDSLDTVVHRKPPDPLSDSEISITVIHSEPDQLMSDRDTCNNTQDTSIASDSDDASTVYTTTDDELSYISDTLDDVSDIELDDDIADIKGLDDHIVAIKELDDDILDIEAIVLQDQDEVDTTTTKNDIADTSTYDNEMFDDDDDLFGILDVYIGSDLHFDLSKMPVAVNSKPDQTEDFGYEFFSFSTFF